MPPIVSSGSLSSDAADDIRKETLRCVLLERGKTVLALLEQLEGDSDVQRNVRLNAEVKALARNANVLAAGLRLRALSSLIPEQSYGTAIQSKLQEELTNTCDDIYGKSKPFWKEFSLAQQQLVSESSITESGIQLEHFWEEVLALWRVVETAYVEVKKEVNSDLPFSDTSPECKSQTASAKSPLQRAFSFAELGEKLRFPKSPSPSAITLPRTPDPSSSAGISISSSRKGSWWKSAFDNRSLTQLPDCISRPILIASTNPHLATARPIARAETFPPTAMTIGHDTGPPSLRILPPGASHLSVTGHSFQSEQPMTPYLLHRAFPQDLRVEDGSAQRSLDWPERQTSPASVPASVTSGETAPDFQKPMAESSRSS